MQRRIGLTGNIASGKSSVGKLLQSRGWPVLDADRYAHDALDEGNYPLKSVIARYGDRIFSYGKLDRHTLGHIVFNDPNERRWLEELIHPLVRKQFDHALLELLDEPIVVLMIPLLFEARLTSLCSEIWIVECNEKQQIDRIMQRDNLNLDEAKARISAQWPTALKRPFADVLIDNRGSLEQLAKSVNHYAQALL